MTSIAPAFPGDLGSYIDQATVTAPCQAPYEPQRREARRRNPGRVRKPVRRRGAILERAARAVSVVAVAFTVGAVIAQLVTMHGAAL